jgi:hypothetical protein
MTPEQAVLARHRLWLGISNVGFWVLASAAGLWWLVWGRGTASSLHPVAVAFGVIAVQGIFDGLGGWWLMPAPRGSAAGVLRGWIRGVLVHSVVLVAVGVVATLSLRWTGGFCTGVAVSSVLLALGRGFFLSAVSGGRIRKAVMEGGETVSVSSVGDPAFTGGIVGFGRGATIVLPESWMDRVPRPEMAVEVFRRRWQIKQGLPGRAFLLVLAWNLIGAWVGGRVVDLSTIPLGHALIGLACWMTLWTFASLLVLPMLGRGTILAADRAAADAGMDPSEWIRLFPKLTGEDGNSRAALQNIFYPIPSVELRLRWLRESRRGLVLGPVARGNLFYSLAGLTLLGRSVHCNVGRPGLWVFPPMT